jgi:hypothetical protein
MYHGKVVIRSLTTKYPPCRNEQCGYVVQSLCALLDKKPNNYGSLKMVVVKHNLYKAVLRFSCEYVTDFVNFKDDFYRYYADRFTWKGNKLWPVE